MSDSTAVLAPRLAAMIGPASSPRDLTVRRVAIDKVPVFWVDSPGQSSAGLVFRVGEADEELATHGLTRLVQQMVLAGSGQVSYQRHAATDLALTSFTAAGTAEEVEDFLARVCTGLRELPPDRLEPATRVLRSRAVQPRDSALGAALSNAFGAQGIGLLGHREWGLAHASVERVSAWRDSWFHVGNAALWVAGPPPRNARLTLPAASGGLAPVRPAEPLEDLPFWCGAVDGGVLLSATVPHSFCGRFVAELLNERLAQTLRTAEGRALRVSTDIQGIGADARLVTMWCEAPQAYAQKIQSAMLQEIRNLTARGPSADEVRQYGSSIERVFADPNTPASEAREAAHRYLLGESFVPITAQIAWFRSAIPNATTNNATTNNATTSGNIVAREQLVAEVRDFATNIERSAVWALDDGCVDRRIRRVSSTSAHVIAGSRHRSTSPASNPRSASMLVLGPSGVTLEVDAATSWTVLLDELAIAVSWNDGGWTFVGRDGVGVAVHPREWVGMAEPLELLLRAVPADLVRRSDEPFLGDAVVSVDPPTRPSGPFDRIIGMRSKRQG